MRKSDCLYTKCYCEENTFKLCEQLEQRRVADLAQISVVFASSPDRRILFQEHGGRQQVLWDYHVFAAVRTAPQKDQEGGHYCWVYDLDSNLDGFPVPLQHYAEHTFPAYLAAESSKERNAFPLQPAHFRVVPAPLYLRHFASDRSHMRTKDGRWSSPPPEWSLIVSSPQGETMTLPRYLDMTTVSSSAVCSSDTANVYGTVMVGVSAWLDFMQSPI